MPSADHHLAKHPLYRAAAAHAGSMTVVANRSFAELMPSQQQQQQQQSESGTPAEPKLHWLLVPGGVGELRRSVEDERHIGLVVHTS
jgi:hypothetical protein